MCAGVCWQPYQLQKLPQSGPPQPHLGQSAVTANTSTYKVYIHVCVCVCADIGVVALSVCFLLSHFFLRFVSRGLHRRRCFSCVS